MQACAVLGCQAASLSLVSCNSKVTWNLQLLRYTAENDEEAEKQTNFPIRQRQASYICTMCFCKRKDRKGSADCTRSYETQTVLFQRFLPQPRKSAGCLTLHHDGLTQPGDL